MNRARTYLDYNATAPLRRAARDAMLAALEATGNPSSVHAEGRQARAIVETAREQLARLVNARPSEVVFTSGAAEANATVMAGPWSDILAARIEHESVLAGLPREDLDFFEMPATADGVVAIDVAKDRVSSGPRMPRGLVTLQLANNETGVLQPVADMAAFAREHGLFLHCDAVQALGRLPIDFAALSCDSMSLSAHKMGGPKGVGALVIRQGRTPPPLIPGGQERRRRGGTENVAAIAGFGAVAEEAASSLEDMVRIGELRDDLERDLRAVHPDVVFVGAESPRLANTSCIALPGLKAETLVIRLDLVGIAVSAGAACSSGKVAASHVLSAMGTAPGIAQAAIRVSLGRETVRADIDRFIAAIHEIAAPAQRRAGSIRVSALATPA